MTGPMNSVGTSMVSSSMGSSISPLGPSFMMTLGRVTANSYPSRRMVSMRIDRCSSPRPLTLKVSVVSVSSTRMDTLVLTSLNSRSRMFRLVTYRPSRPAKGLSLTEKVISMVGADIFTKGRGSGVSGSQIVSPMVMSDMPDMAMMLPAVDSVTGTRVSPSNS